MPSGPQALGVWVIVPAYNEAEIISSVVHALRRQGWPVLVVDDGSQDRTPERARAAGALVLRHVINRGQGAALQTGIECALQQRAKVIVTFDADGQHDPGDVVALVRPIARAEADVVLGSRFLGTAANLSKSRQRLLRLGVWFTRIMSGVKVTDSHNGLRAFSAAAAAKLSITQDRMAHASQIVDQVGAMGVRVIEVPVHLTYTEYSKRKGQRTRGAFTVLVDYLIG